MPTRLSDPQQNVAILNSALSQLDVANRNIATLKTAVQGVQQTVNATEQLVKNPSITNLSFTWGGSNSTVSWQGGYYKNSQGKTVSIASGSRFLSPSTQYWVYYNPVHTQMVFTPTQTAKVTNNSLNLAVCSLKTGTAAQNGYAGGGGTEPQGYGNVGYKYTNF